MAVAAVNAHLVPSPGSPVSDKRMRSGVRTNQPSPDPTNYPPPSLPSNELVCQTREIIHETFHILLSDNGIRSNGYTTGLVEPKFSSEVNRRACLSLTYACRQLFKQNTERVIQTDKDIDLSESTLCSTFHMSMYGVLPSDMSEMKWGRVVALVCFAVMVATKAHRNGKGEIMDSVEGWLINFINLNLHPFIMKNKGWAGVPEKFNPEKLRVTSDASKKNNGGSLLTLAAVGVGAALVTAFLTS